MRLLALLLLAGCDQGQCIDAPPAPLPRTSCEHARLEVVIHHAPRPSSAIPDDARIERQLSEAAEVMPAGVELEVVAVEEASYWPHLDATDCEAFDAWGDRVAVDDGRIHVFAMHTIQRGDLDYEGLTRGQSIALLPDAQWGIAAHEIGHVLGLHHADDGLMVEGDIEPGSRFTAEQGATMLAYACASET